MTEGDGGAGPEFTVLVIAADRCAQQVVPVRVAHGETTLEVWQRSGLAGLEAREMPCGFAIFGVPVPPDTVLRPGDRVEVLRPLRVDPREARRRRAAPHRRHSTGGG